MVSSVSRARTAPVQPFVPLGTEQLTVNSWYVTHSCLNDVRLGYVWIALTFYARTNIIYAPANPPGIPWLIRYRVSEQETIERTPIGRLFTLDYAKRHRFPPVETILLS